MIVAAVLGLISVTLGGATYTKDYMIKKHNLESQYTFEKKVETKKEPTLFGFKIEKIDKLK